MISTIRFLVLSLGGLSPLLWDFLAIFGLDSPCFFEFFDNQFGSRGIYQNSSASFSDG
jgi:hypothetical protein